MLGQEAVTDKSNEIVAIPLLLKRLELKGALVTIDAIGTQVEIAKIIVNGGGDYLLALKDNWPAFRAEVETFFADDTNATAFQTFDTTDADHGRLEQRHHVVCQEVDWLLSERRFPKERPFPRMAMIAMVQTATERAGKVEREKRYYILKCLAMPRRPANARTCGPSGCADRRSRACGEGPAKGCAADPHRLFSGSFMR